MTRVAWLGVYIVLGLTPVESFADFTGSVVSVLDGDTIEILHNQRPERIRLSGIDCPERGQSFDLLADPAASDTGVVALTQRGAGRVAGVREGH